MILPDLKMIVPILQVTGKGFLPGMRVYQLPANSSNEKILRAIKNDGIPNWIQCKQLIEKVDSLKDLPPELKERTRLIKIYCDYRIESFTLMASNLEAYSPIEVNLINTFNKKIDLIVRKLTGENGADSLILMPKKEETFLGLPEGILFIVNEKPTDKVININPEDIESINILKGEPAKKIYGKRAEKGVIVITTKNSE